VRGERERERERECYFFINIIMHWVVTELSNALGSTVRRYRAAIVWLFMVFFFLDFLNIKRRE
jgi:hypothetical protein